MKALVTQPHGRSSGAFNCSTDPHKDRFTFSYWRPIELVTNDAGGAQSPAATTRSGDRYWQCQQKAVRCTQTPSAAGCGDTPPLSIRRRNHLQRRGGGVYWEVVVGRPVEFAVTFKKDAMSYCTYAPRCKGGITKTWPQVLAVAGGDPTEDAEALARAIRWLRESEPER